MRNILGTKSLLTDISHSIEHCQKRCEIEFIFLKNEKEIDQLRESAHLVRDLLFQLHKVIKPGIQELDIASFCENYILIRGADPILKSRNIFPSSVSISKNNIAFHGIPDNSVLEDGDILTVDIVLRKNGWFGDGAWTYIVGSSSDQARKLVQFASDVIYTAVDCLEVTGDLSSIGQSVSKECKEIGFRVLSEGAGHGIGRSLHEDPQVLFSPGAESFKIIPGMVFTIEPVVSNCSKKLKYNENRTAYQEKDAITAQFEHMIAIKESGIEILTSRRSLFK